jgi:hypothetical protein
MSASTSAAVTTVHLSGHLTAQALAAALAPVTMYVEAGRRVLLLVDCRTMTGYDAEARALFVSWNKAHRHRVDRVAIVTDNRLWHMVISAMSLASRQEMRPFADPAGAERWLEERMVKAS